MHLIHLLANFTEFFLPRSYSGQLFSRLITSLKLAKPLNWGIYIHRRRVAAIRRKYGHRTPIVASSSTPSPRRSVRTTFWYEETLHFFHRVMYIKCNGERYFIEGLIIRCNHKKFVFPKYFRRRDSEILKRGKEKRNNFIQTCSRTALEW